MKRALAVLLILFFFGLSAQASEPFAIPSTVSFGGGGGSDDNSQGFVSLAKTLPSNWQVLASAYRSKSPTETEGEFYTTTGASFGASTDPLNTLSFSASLNTSRADDEVRAFGTSGGLLWAINDNWEVSLTASGQRHVFSGLPTALYTDGEEQVLESSLRFDWSYFVSKWTFTFFGSAHNYDENLEDFSSGTRALFTPSTVLTYVAGLPQSELGLGMNYSLNKWSLGSNLVISRAAVDQVKTGILELSGYYKLNRRWSFGLELSNARPFDSDEGEDSSEDSDLSETTTSGVLSATFSW